MPLTLVCFLTVLERGAIFTRRIALGRFLLDEFVVDRPCALQVDRRLRFGSRLHGCPTSAVGEVDDVAAILLLNARLIDFIR